MKTLNMSKPTFVGLGPGKAGTTWLYSCLSQNPEVCMAEIKETYFFTENYGRGIDWYGALFKKEALAYGEISNRYIFSDDVIPRVLSVNPEAKFILFNRDALDRAVSAYLFEVQTGFSGTVQDFFSKDKILEFDNSELLRKCQRYLPKSQLMVISFDDIRAHPNEVYKNVCEFIGVSSAGVNFEGGKNPSRMPRNLWLSKIGKWLAILMRKFGMYSLLQGLKSSEMIQGAFYGRQITQDEKSLVRAEIENFIPDSFNIEA